MQSTVKPPEEGRLWEWRAFGRISRRLAAKIKEHPIRLGIENQSEDDTYLVSAVSDQNVKLRNYASGTVLKLKLLFAAGPDLIELYDESATYIHRFPVTRREVEETAHLLRVKLGKIAFAIDSFTPAEFISALEKSSPPVMKVDVSKRRTQYDFGEGWIEVADVIFPHHQVQTISIQSPDFEVVKGMLMKLRPSDELEAMNYVEACRRWA
ncbi:MAG TPA: hypothetical protein VNN73_16790 [Blastocatellia bacterium]|nr:hypothetical protein [Blastocatellia bacterium]